MGSSRASIEKLQAEVRRLAARAQDHAVYVDLAAGQLSLEHYQRLLWILRQVHVGVESQAYNARAAAVATVRKGLVRKVPVLERDLVAACGYSLHVPRAVNDVLNAQLAFLAKPTTPARILGRLLFLEALTVGHAMSLSGFAAAGRLPADAGRYFGLNLDSASYLRVGQAFSEALTGEVPQTNAVQAARDLSDMLLSALDVARRSQSDAHSAERSA